MKEIALFKIKNYLSEEEYDNLIFAVTLSWGGLNNACIYPQDNYETIGGYLSGAFTWDNTPERHLYWSNIHKRLINIKLET